MISFHEPSSSTRAPGSVTRRLTLWLLLAALGVPAVAAAQGFGPDPYRPYNNQYDSFVYPVAPGPLDYGQNQSPVRNGIRGANQFDRYMDSLLNNGSGTASTRGPAGGRVGTPYYRGANRAVEREGANYQLNNGADARFESNQEMLTDLYFKYLRERDPKKRADLFRQYSLARNRADRDLASPRASGSRSGTRKSRKTETDPQDAYSAQQEPANREAGDGSSESDAPPIPALRGRTRSRRGGGVDRSTTGPAPPPLYRRPMTGAEASDAEELLPSRVLDRAERSDRSRVGPRARVPSPSAVSPGKP